ncbi:plasmid transfer protein [Pedobacter sp. Leaf216]|uniref:DUF4134 family protein n=1 Tax=Pedobacter sp. Leaf216 TaxID=1735684 RepID=UPI0006F6F7EE|nr:DUF4134 family protein [Pedobacter sp. Leaf216]KQM69219.1 plasmid transfer protein [Pedobacter sp. Leaf216]
MGRAVQYLMLAALTAVAGISARAQDPPGISELYQASGTMKGYYHGFSDLVFLLGAIVGLLGGLRVFANWQSGRHHIDAQVSGWFFSCLFLLLSGTFLRGVFGL